MLPYQYSQMLIVVLVGLMAAKATDAMTSTDEDQVFNGLDSALYILGKNEYIQTLLKSLGNNSSSGLQMISSMVDILDIHDQPGTENTLAHSPGSWAVLDFLVADICKMLSVDLLGHNQLECKENAVLKLIKVYLKLFYNAQKFQSRLSPGCTCQ